MPLAAEEIRHSGRDHQGVRMLAGYGRSGLAFGLPVVVRDRLLNSLERLIDHTQVLLPLGHIHSTVTVTVW